LCHVGLVDRIRHGLAKQSQREKVKRNMTMAWTTPTLVEICIGLEINGYLPAEI
jgi:coenzyme PQQ precursor peptide PqqA